MSFLDFNYDPERAYAKICGVRDLAAAEACHDLGAEAIGINFWPKSKRYLPPENALWLTAIPSGLVRVGVFVNPTLDEILTVTGKKLIDLVQLHGDETPEKVASLVDELDLPVIKAFGVGSEETLSDIQNFEVPAIVLDAFCPGEYGGSGKVFDWKMVQVVREANPKKKVILSGGLKVENVGEAVRSTKPYAVDVASGVEISPGVKDLGLVKHFLRNARTPI